MSCISLRGNAPESSFSLNSDNYAQLGYIERARDALRPGDRHAIDRWDLSQIPILGLWRAALGIWFPESELRLFPGGSLSSSVIEVPAAPPGEATAVMAIDRHRVGIGGRSRLGGRARSRIEPQDRTRAPPDPHRPLLVPALHAREASGIAIPGAGGGIAAVPFPYHLPRTGHLGQVAPRHSGPQSKQHPLPDLAVVGEATAHAATGFR